MKTIITHDSIVIFENDGEVRIIPRSDPNYNALANGIIGNNLDEEAINDLADPSAYLDKASDGKLRFQDEIPQLKQTDGTWINIPKQTHDRLMHFIQERNPLNPFIHFHEHLQKNPSFNSREQLFNFIDDRNMAVTPSGEIFGYKGVQSDYWSHHGNQNTKLIQGVTDGFGRILNTVGSTIEMERSQVDDNPDHGCSAGLHLGTHAYANNWRGDDGRFMLVTFNPVDAVSVPNDGFEKLRVSKYTVVADITENPHALTLPCYTVEGEKIEAIEKAQNIEGVNFSDIDPKLLKILQAKLKLSVALAKGKSPKLEKFLVKHDIDIADIGEVLEDNAYVDQGRIKAFPFDQMPHNN